MRSICFGLTLLASVLALGNAGAAPQESAAPVAPPATGALVEEPGLQGAPAAPPSSAATEAAPAPAPVAAPAAAPAAGKAEAGGDKLKPTVTPSGRIQLLVWSDPQNQGDVPDQSVVPDGALKKEWNSSVHLNASATLRFAYPKPVAGFLATGLFTAAVQIRRIFSVPVAGFMLDNQRAGVKIGVGKFVQPTLSVLAPSSFQFSSNWGNVLHATTGAYVAKTFGKVLAQVGFGRPSLPDFTEAFTATASAAPPLPFWEARLAYVDPARKGQVPSGPVRGQHEQPLTISVSGAVGQQRVGVGEKTAVAAVDPTAVDPVIEDVTSWLVSAEALLPLSGFVLAGEYYVGRGANAYNGAVRQRPRVEAATGRHRALFSRGGWLQLSYVLPESITVLGLVGIENVTGDLGYGISVDGPQRVSENRLIATSISKNFEFGMHAGIQLQHQSTSYRGLDTGSIFAVLLESSIVF
jgi:hypothetical protein